MRWHLLQVQGVETIFLRTPITVYNYVFQENSQYSSRREQRLQAISNRWANLSAFGGIFSLARSCGQGRPPRCKVREAPVGAGGGGLTPALSRQPGTQPRKWDWNVHRWNGGHNRASPICPASIVRNSWWGWEHAGDTTHEVLASASAAQAGCGAEWTCFFLPPFLPRRGRQGALGAATHLPTTSLVPASQF